MPTGLHYAAARRTWARDEYGAWERGAAMLACGQLMRIAANCAYAWVAPAKEMDRFFFLCDATDGKPTPLPALHSLEAQLLRLSKK